jgi:mRNA interferase MazF
MITSAENRGWPGDVTISNLASAGLPVPSVVRTAKIATIEVADATKLGRVSAASLKQVIGKVGRELGM